MTRNGHVETDEHGNVTVGAPSAAANGHAPAPNSADPATQVAVVNLGVPVAPRAIVGILTDGSPVLYEQKGD